jgi:hypothetical protein
MHFVFFEKFCSSLTKRYMQAIRMLKMPARRVLGTPAQCE